MADRPIQILSQPPAGQLAVSSSDKNEIAGAAVAALMAVAMGAVKWMCLGFELKRPTHGHFCK
eukprot:scaffold65817_cov68-Attheya_sp.AAC.4